MKRKTANGGNFKRKRKHSLKSLALIDDLDCSETLKQITFPPDSSTRFSECTNTDVVSSGQIKLKLNRYQCQGHEQVIKMQPKHTVDENRMDEYESPFGKLKSLDWTENDSFMDYHMLNYRTPVKNNNAMESTQQKKENSFNQESKQLNLISNELDDSVFESVDLSMLEKECLTTSSASESCKRDDVSVCYCDKEMTKHADCTAAINNNVEKKSSITSTPIPVETSGSFTKRVKMRLMENARKTPQSTSTLSELTCKTTEAFYAKSTCNKMEPSLCLDDLSTQDIGPFYGLPSKVQQLLQDLRGIKSLYEWQHDCLTRSEVKAGKNLIYSLPTSGGKTLVAEILIMKTLLCCKKDAILVLPFVALVQEKIQNICQFAVELGFLVEEYAAGKGRFPPRKRRKRNVLYVCTIEKANSLVNSLIENNRLDEIKLVVVDELHMIGEGGRRGATIETMLAKILHISASTQIIAMSATLGNAEELATFLDATVYTNNFRPVELDEYVKVMSSLFRVDQSKLHPDEKLVKERTLFYQSKHLAAKDSDHLASLVMEVIPKHSCLVFCPTKKNCENVALLISEVLPKDFLQHHKHGKLKVLRALQNESGELCPTLCKTIPYGIAYHHSGLTTDERRIIEDAYRNEILSVIACTSTLAAGVNLPARRVIIRSPHIGREFMSRAQYKQMIGRAGRAGIDTKGESYLIVSKLEDQERICDLVIGPLETCISSLMYDGGKGFKAMLLNLIGLKIISHATEVTAFFNRTLFVKQLKRIRKCRPDLLSGYVQARDDNDSEMTVDEISETAIKYLLKLNLIQTAADDRERFRPTRLGIAVFKGGIELDIANYLYRNLKRGLETLVLDTCLHLLYLVTPYDVCVNITPNWFIYMSEINRLTESELTAASLVGVPEQYIASRASGNNPKKKKVDELAIKRFYVTLMLYELFKGKSVWEVSVRFEQARGFLQSLVSSSAAFASCVLHFTKEFEEFWPYQALLERLIQVLQYCTVAELVPLMEIPSVKLARAKQLYKAGYKSLANLASANPSSLLRNIEHLSRKQAQQIIASAQILLTEKIESLQEEVEELKQISK